MILNFIALRLLMNYFILNLISYQLQIYNFMLSYNLFFLLKNFEYRFSKLLLYQFSNCFQNLSYYLFYFNLTFFKKF